jgi:hypothetical protein
LPYLANIKSNESQAPRYWTPYLFGSIAGGNNHARQHSLRCQPAASLESAELGALRPNGLGGHGLRAGRVGHPVLAEYRTPADRAVPFRGGPTTGSLHPLTWGTADSRSVQARPPAARPMGVVRLGGHARRNDVSGATRRIGGAPGHAHPTTGPERRRDRRATGQLCHGRPQYQSAARPLRSRWRVDYGAIQRHRLRPPGLAAHRSL